MCGFCKEFNAHRKAEAGKDGYPFMEALCHICEKKLQWKKLSTEVKISLLRLKEMAEAYPSLPSREEFRQIMRITGDYATSDIPEGL